jgi:hypothetical protein
VAFSEALDHFHWALYAVTYWCIAMAIKKAAKLLHVVIIVLFSVALAATGAIRSE